jgi:hypothetical protein
MNLKELQEQILIAPHPDMEPHVKRGAFFLIDSELDLASVALAIAQNDENKIAKLIDDKKIVRPDLNDLENWKKYKTFFRFIIVQPFVIAQKLTDLEAPKG